MEDVIRMKSRDEDGGGGVGGRKEDEGRREDGRGD